MGCPSCGAENPLTNKFCGHCGAALVLACAKCGERNPPTNQFCGGCGTRRGVGNAASPSAPAADVTAQPPPETYTPRHLAEKILAGRDVLAGERKQVTVLFADVVGSTELIRDRDPEDAQQLLDGVVQLMMDAVHRYEGTVSRLMGDGLMAMFGAPIAHEDHAVRACYAALALLEAARRHAETLRQTHGIAVAVRVGISSGEVVVRTIRDDLHMDYTAMGQTVHLASRMEGIAEPGTAVLSAETLAIVEGYVQVRALGPVPIKGLPEPVEVYQLLGAGQARTRLQVSAASGLTRFVGRESEMTALYRALDRASDGQGQLAALVGEPGVGKSRLVWELTHSHRTQNWLVLESGSVSYGKATSYLPVIDLLKAYCRIETADDARAIREKVTGKLLALDEGLRPVLPAVLSLLDIASSDLDWESLDPAQRRRQTLDAVRRLLLRESQAQPLLLVFEDLHWFDSETQALLDGLTESLPTARMLLLVNYRPEYTHSWGSKSFYTQLRIDPLGEASAEELLAGLLGDHASLGPLKGLLTTRTDGNPLFLEESVRSLVETGAMVGERGAYQLPIPVTSLQVPSTVQAVMAARIDRLPADEKALLQTAAVIGKDVPDVLLRAIADCTDDDLQRNLAHLQAAEFLYQVRLFPELEYTFKHALTHEVAYGSLLQDRRKSIHARVVGAIEAAYPDRLDEHVEVLAHHALRAELWEQVAAYCLQASTRAIALSAYREAVIWFEAGLDALPHLPDSRETSEIAIDLRLAVRSVVAQMGDFLRAEAMTREAEAIATAISDGARLSQIHVHMAIVLRTRGDYEGAIKRFEHAIQLAEVMGDASVHTVARAELAFLHRDRGDLRQAIDGLRATSEALTTMNMPDLRRVSIASSIIPLSRAFLAWTLAETGEFDEALVRGGEAAQLAEADSNIYRSVVAVNILGRVHHERGSFEQAIPLLQRGLEISQAHELLNPLIWAMSEIGSIQTLSGHVTEGLPLLERAVEMAAKTGVRQGYALWSTWLGEGYLAAGRLAAARTSVEDALDYAVRHRERHYQAYALRLLSEIAALSDAQDKLGSAERYRETLALAVELGMRPLQAHCHLGLGKLYRQMGRMDEAKAELQAAVMMLREMGMAYWLPEAEAEIALLPETDR